MASFLSKGPPSPPHTPFRPEAPTGPRLSVQPVLPHCPFGPQTHHPSAPPGPALALPGLLLGCFAWPELSGALLPVLDTPGPPDHDTSPTALTSRCSGRPGAPRAATVSCLMCLRCLAGGCGEARRHLVGVEWQSGDLSEGGERWGAGHRSPDRPSPCGGSHCTGGVLGLLQLADPPQPSLVPLSPPTLLDEPPSPRSRA